MLFQNTDYFTKSIVESTIKNFNDSAIYQKSLLSTKSYSKIEITNHNTTSPSFLADAIITTSDLDKRNDKNVENLVLGYQFLEILSNVQIKSQTNDIYVIFDQIYPFLFLTIGVVGILMNGVILVVTLVNMYRESKKKERHRMKKELNKRKILRSKNDKNKNCKDQKISRSRETCQIHSGNSNIDSQNPSTVNNRKRKTTFGSLFSNKSIKFSTKRLSFRRFSEIAYRKKPFFSKQASTKLIRGCSNVEGSIQSANNSNNLSGHQTISSTNRRFLGQIAFSQHCPKSIPVCPKNGNDDWGQKSNQTPASDPKTYSTELLDNITISNQKMPNNKMICTCSLKQKSSVDLEETLSNTEQLGPRSNTNTNYQNSKESDVLTVSKSELNSHKTTNNYRKSSFQSNFSTRNGISTSLGLLGPISGAFSCANCSIILAEKDLNSNYSDGVYGKRRSPRRSNSVTLPLSTSSSLIYRTSLPRADSVIENGAKRRSSIDISINFMQQRREMMITSSNPPFKSGHLLQLKNLEVNSHINLSDNVLNCSHSNNFQRFQQKLMEKRNFRLKNSFHQNNSSNELRKQHSNITRSSLPRKLSNISRVRPKKVFTKIENFRESVSKAQVPEQMVQNLKKVSTTVVSTVVTSPWPGFWHQINNLALWEYILLNLLLADLIFCLTIPSLAIEEALDNWIFSNTSCKMVSFTSLVNLYASVYFIAWMALHRSSKIGLDLVNLFKVNLLRENVKKGYFRVLGIFSNDLKERDERKAIESAKKTDDKNGGSQRNKSVKNRPPVNKSGKFLVTSDYRHMKAISIWILATVISLQALFFRKSVHQHSGYYIRPIEYQETNEIERNILDNIRLQKRALIRFNEYDDDELIKKRRRRSDRRKRTTATNYNHSDDPFHNLIEPGLTEQQQLFLNSINLNAMNRSVSKWSIPEKLRVSKYVRIISPDFW